MPCFSCNTYITIQVRGYTRGMMMLALGPAIRRRLLHRMNKLGIDTAGLRSFLDPPHQRGKTIAGSGEVGYAMHTRNTTNMNLTVRLRNATTEYLQEDALLRNLRFSVQAKFIGNRICISGRYHELCTQTVALVFQFT